MNERSLALVVVLSTASLVSMGVTACGSKRPTHTAEAVVADPNDGGADAAPEPPPPPKTLYEKLGGIDAIKAVVDKFIENVTIDPRVKASFAKTRGAKLEAFKKSLTDQICAASGGPAAVCTYQGKDMKAAHKGRKITDAQFDAVVEDLKNAMVELKVPDEEQNEVLALLAPMKEDIVEVKPKAKK